MHELVGVAMCTRIVGVAMSTNYWVEPCIQVSRSGHVCEVNSQVVGVIVCVIRSH